MTGFTQADVIISFLEGRNDSTPNGFSFGTPATQLNGGELIGGRRNYKSILYRGSHSPERRTCLKKGGITIQSVNGIYVT